MKLSQLTEGAVPPGTLRYFQKNQTGYSVNDDGSINLDHNFDVHGSIPMDFPKINHVAGDFSMQLLNGRVWKEVMPVSVEGNCTIEVGEGQVVKTSELPKCTIETGVILLTGHGHLEIDDDTISSYKEQKFDIWITKGLEHLPRHIEVPALRFLNTIDGIPPSIKAITLGIKSDDGSLIKGLHRRCQSLNLDVLYLDVPYDTPILSILKFPGIKLFHMFSNNSFYTAEQLMQLNNMMNRAINDKLDIFEVQEAMIDAGFGRNAKL